MIILKVRNKTASPIASLGLNASETKIICYQRSFWSKEVEIRAAILADQIEFIDSDGNVVAKFNSSPVAGIDGEQYLNEIFLIYRDKPDEDKELDLQAIGQKLLIAIKGLFRNFNASNPTYTRAMMKAAIGDIPTMLRNGDLSDAGTAIGNITTDAFWTTQRKNAIKAIVNSIDI